MFKIEKIIIDIDEVYSINGYMLSKNNECIKCFATKKEAISFIKNNY